MKETIKKYLLLALLITLFSEIHFYPLHSTLRISLGIIIINVIGLVRDDVEPMPLVFLSGFVIFLERLAFNMAFFDMTYTDAFLTVIPSLGYYICFGVLFEVSDIFGHRDNFFRTFLLLAGIDAASNCFEALIRGNFAYTIIMVVCLVGLIRSFSAYAIYFVWRRKELFIVNQEHQKRYSQLNMLVANVESELFYLQKSSADIEDVMRKCYHLYEQTDQEDPKKNQTLDIAKDIHEIKKDYIRVLSGFQDFVDNLQHLEHLKITDIFEIMKTNYNKVKQEIGKDIQFIYEHDEDPFMENYLNIFTILNNLIDNSIAACEDGSTIHISYESKSDMHCFRVIDNGKGIDPASLGLIFNPGFTTKYDKVTGKASTGIGLAHVKNIVGSLNGHINVESIPKVGTKFTITLPKTTERSSNHS